MPRFGGIPVQQGDVPDPQAAVVRRPRFGGVPVQAAEPTGPAYEPDSLRGEFRTALGGIIEGIPIVGPSIREGADMASAATRAAFTDDTYDQAYNRIQRQNAAEKEANPIVDAGAQIAGGIAGTAPLVAAAPAAFGVTGASVPARMVAGGVSGGLLGGADGAVRNGGEGAVIGGGAGLLLGGAAPMAGNLAGRGWAALRTGQANRAAAAAAGTSPEAVDVVSRGVMADRGGLSISAAPDAMLADAGPASRSMLDTAIQRAGPGAGRASERIEARANAATGNINAALDRFLGPAEGIQTATRGIREGTAGARRSAYDAAYQTPIDYALPEARDLEALVARVPGDVIGKANRLMGLEGQSSRQILANIADDGTVSYQTLPDTRQIDYITRALNQAAESGEGAGALGGQTQLGRAYQSLSRDIRSSLRGLNPAYGEALDTAAEPIARRQAMQFGSELLRASTPRDAVSEFVRGASAAELQAVRSGIRSQVDETLANVRRTITDPNVDARQGIAALRDLSSDAAREKIAAILPEDQAAALFGEIDNAATAFELRAGVTTNSRTYGRQAAERVVDDLSAPGIIENAADIRPQGTMQAVARALFGTGPEATLARKDAIWSSVADLLTAPANASQQRIINALTQVTRQQPAIASQSAVLDALFSRAGAGLAPQGQKLLGAR